ncbi:uncharacterized protein METZ01_LOCUS506978, partial [marine metagenome]
VQYLHLCDQVNSLALFLYVNFAGYLIWQCSVLMLGGQDGTISLF